MPLVPISPLSLAAADPGADLTPVQTTVNGKTYIANVNYAAGEYVAEDMTVFGAVGTGASPQAAEEAFSDRIDFLA
jgi:hypothetical protein